MKKKGLIISTVVMVVVLIASLTTATYAWFTASNKTTLQGFQFSVVAGNAVNIGVKQNNEHSNEPVDGDFRSGQVIYTAGTAGELLKNGRWDGTTGLSATLEHNIVWGEQSKAVGAINGETNSKSSTASEYGFIGKGSFDGKPQVEGVANTVAAKQKTFLNAANLGENNATLTNVEAANPNLATGTTTNGDYAYMFLGVSPTKTLKSNKLVMLLDGSGSTGTNIGMLAAVHVAYRTTFANGTTSEWKEQEFFAGKKYSDTLESATLNSTEWGAAYQTAYGSAAPTKKASAIVIEGFSTTQGAIDQIEMIVYLAGADDDCRDNAKGTSGDIKIFFNAVDADKVDDFTSATIDENGKLTVVGDGTKHTATTKVEVKVGEGAWSEVQGTWTTGRFVSTNALTGITKDSVVNVRLTETNKAPSTEKLATNNMTA